MVEVYVGAGSNREPRRHLLLAVAALTERYGRLRCSEVYRSPAFGFSGADFLNMVIAFAADDTADEVKRALADIEYAGGRARDAPRFSPHTLDLDLLLVGATVDPPRRLPREDVRRFPFVLAPLADLAPALRHPLTGRTLAEEWRAMQAAGRPTGLVRLGRLEVLD